MFANFLLFNGLIMYLLDAGSPAYLGLNPTEKQSIDSKYCACALSATKKQPLD